MDAITALHSRNSVNLLEKPGPSQKQLNNIFKAGLRACDHKSLSPWRFLLIEGDARHKFGKLMADVKRAMSGGKIDVAMAEKMKSKPLRAPTIIVVVARIMPHDKVPKIEQILSAGASAQMMMVAAHAQGIGAIWRSGSLMFRPEMHTGLGLNETDQIIGFLYMGTPRTSKPLTTPNPNDFVELWQG